ncbi:MAG: stage II sporulation protein M [Thermodesulfobacteriota bacterium]
MTKAKPFHRLQSPDAPGPLFPDRSFIKGWLRLIAAYLASFVLSFVGGSILITFLKVAPETVFEVSTKRLSLAFPIMQSAASLGLDEGIVLFAWNSLGALITTSFLYSGALFNPKTISHSPQSLRKIFSGSRRMKLLCFLPGCRSFEAEPLRRLYVWLLIPWLGMILLGLESGLIVSTSASIFGSLAIGLFSLIPHGIVEIPAFAFAGTLSFSAHLLIKRRAWGEEAGDIFPHLESYTKSIPLLKVLLIVFGGLLLAGVLEAHLTPQIIAALRGS